MIRIDWSWQKNKKYYVISILVCILVMGLVRRQWIDFMVQGLFTGLGVGTAAWIVERHVRTRLDKIDSSLNKIQKQEVVVLQEVRKDGN